MKTKAHELIDKVNEASHIDDHKKEAIVEKIKEWQSDKNAESNRLAVAFEKFWDEIEPIFAELGWV